MEFALNIVIKAAFTLTRVRVRIRVRVIRMSEVRTSGAFTVTRTKQTLVIQFGKNCEIP